MPKPSSNSRDKENQPALHADVKSAARALDILELLSESSEGLTLTDLGKKLEIPLSSLHGLTTTMINRGYLVRSELDLLFRLGPRLSQIAYIYQGQVDLVPLADPVMLRLRNETSETASLAILEGTSIVFIHKRPAEGRIQVVSPVGSRLPAHTTGSGKVMLSYLSEEELDYLYPGEQLPAYTANTITTRQGLKDVLALARENGFAYDDQESEVGVWAVASCIRDRDGHPIAAISVAAPVFRIQDKDYMQWYRHVLAGAAEVSAKLGFRSR